MNAEAIGKRLRQIRLSKMLSVKDVCDSLNISQSALRNYELGIRVPRDQVKTALARFYGCSVDSIFFA